MRIVLALAAALSLAAVGIVGAASPKKDVKFNGAYDPPQKFLQFEAKVSFRTSGDGKRVVKAKVDFGPCGGFGGGTENPYERIKFPAMDVDEDGKFSGTKKRHVTQGDVRDETFKVRGRFTKAKQAKGKAIASADYENPNFTDCGPEKRDWKAKAN